MHRVDTKKRRTTILRFIAYGVTLTLTVITTVLLIYIALGYRIGSTGHVVRNGLLLVDNRPEAAQVFIDNVQKDTSAPSRFVLPAGNYGLALKLSGYHDWTKQVKVTASGVRDVNYPLLIPTTLQARSLAQLITPDVVSQSQNRKSLLLYNTQQSQLQLVELDFKEPKITNISLSSAVRREVGQLGSLRVIEWSLNNKHVLLEQTLPSGAKALLSVDVTKPEEAVNISALFGDQSPEDIHYVGGNTNEIYGIKNGVLARYNIKDSTSALLLQNVKTYTPYGDDTVLFSRTVNETTTQIGIRQNEIDTVIEQSSTPTSQVQLKYAEYDDHFYFVIGYNDGEVVTVYRDPLQKPILTKQLPFTKLAFSQPQKIEFSGSAQFILVQSGKRVLTYDMDDLLAYSFDLPFESAPNTTVTWVDDAHLQAIASDQKSSIFDYDGSNQHVIANVRNGSKLFYSDNFQHVYSLGELENKVSLSVISLVSGKQ